MKRFPVFAALIALPALSPVFLQGQMWSRNLGPGIGWHVIEADDGNYVVVGTKLEWNETWEWQYENLWLFKADAETGNILWEKVYGDTIDEDHGYWVEQTPDGGYIIVGGTKSLSQSDQGLWLLKTDDMGDTVWTRIYEGNVAECGHCVRVTNDYCYIVSGGTCSFSSSDEFPDLWLLKIDQQGDTIWTRTYDGGGGTEQAYCVQQTKDGGYILTGRRGVIKTDEDGDSLWGRFYEKNEMFYVIQTDDGSYIMTGGYGYNADRLIVHKINEQGDSVWTKYYLSCDTSLTCGHCVQQTDNGGYIITGSNGYELTLYGDYDFDLWLLKIDSDGDTIWTRTYEEGMWDFGCCVQQTRDGGYIITGGANNHWGGGGDLWLLKTDELGRLAVEEERIINVPEDFQLLSSIGPQIVLRYADRPKGFHASFAVFDATGSMVDELHATGASGMITWGRGYSPGVYFIRSVSDSPATTHKVILIQ
jgi:hypothetical protein